MVFQERITLRSAKIALLYTVEMLPLVEKYKSLTTQLVSPDLSPVSAVKLLYFSSSDNISTVYGK